MKHMSGYKSLNEVFSRGVVGYGHSYDEAVHAVIEIIPEKARREWHTSVFCSMLRYTCMHWCTESFSLNFNKRAKVDFKGS